NGEPKLVKKLTYPSSGSRKADMVVTDKAVFTFKNGKMTLVELDPSCSLEELKKITDAEFEVALNQHQR
ncbi:succinyl-CoA--3-ketoacid-CoA transferase, partial [Anoxybacillus sp. LAT_38]|nr:succinyl-CoA--3-ketoacid-CoA transferase [Anoxybacillus sp. LAT_38]